MGKLKDGRGRGHSHGVVAADPDCALLMPNFHQARQSYEWLRARPALDAPWQLRARPHACCYWKRLVVGLGSEWQQPMSCGL